MVTDILPASNGTALNIRTSTDGGSSYDAGASDYRYVNIEGNDGTTSVGADASTGDTGLKLADTLDSAAGEGFSGVIELYAPSATSYTKFVYRAETVNQADSAVKLNYGCGRRNSKADVDAVRFLMSSGNIASGTIALYGIKKA